MAEQTQVRKPQPAQSKGRFRVSKRTRGWIIVCVISLLITIIAIIIFNRATAGNFPTVFGLKSTDFAVIFSNDLSIAGTFASIISFIITIYISIRDNTQSKDEMGASSVSSGPSTTVISGDNASGNSVSGNAFMTGSTFSGTTTIYMATPSAQSTTLPTSEPVRTSPPETTSGTPKPQSSGSLSFHTAPIAVRTDVETIQQRENTVKDVYSELIRPDAASVVLIGMGGEGKSTLAGLVFNYVNEQRLAHPNTLFQAESLWFTMKNYNSFQGMAESILKALHKDVSKFGELSPLNQVVALLNALNEQERPRLIVIDQFEDLLDKQTGKAMADRPGVGEFIDVLNSSPCRCRILLTSRLLPVGTRPTSQASLRRYRVGGLSSNEGVDLLRKQGIGVERATDKELQKAVVLCKGHAMALTLLVTLLERDQYMTLNTLLQQSRYESEWGDEIARELLDDIYRKYLNDEQRELLLAFSIYNKPVPREAAKAILRVPDTAINATLHALLNEHLLQSESNECYQLHAIVAEYAHTHFVVNNEQANEVALRKAHEKAAQYYLQLPRVEHDKRHVLEDVQTLVDAVQHYCEARIWQHAYEIMDREHLFASLRTWGENSILLELCELLIGGIK